MCSRSKEKAQGIVDALLEGKGYEKEVTGALSGQGGCCIPPTPAEGWKIRAGDNSDASNADLIVLGTMYEQAWPLLETIAPAIKGKGKIILDMTNPFLKRPDGHGAGLPEDGPQAGILIHKKKLNDPTAQQWVASYKHVMWSLILPTGPKNPPRPDIEVFGDDVAVNVVVELIHRHGWRPIVRGGLEVAPEHEGGVVSFGKIWGNLKREVRLGEKLSVGW
jgi:predicted dinucleotide-binding enzyme